MSRIIICGKAGSGKDFFKKKLLNKGFKAEVSYTTRPMRDGEVDGVTYHFISEEEFGRMEEEGKFYEANEFNGWKYGTTKFEFNTKQLFIMTPSGIAQVHKRDREKSVVIYLDIPEEIRRDRLKERSDADSVDRRIEADEKDFKDFTDYNIHITNPEF